MVIRCGIYEMLEYLKQVENKEYKRLVTQIMVAFYTGPKKWNVPVKLSDYFEIPLLTTIFLLLFLSSALFESLIIKEISNSKRTNLSG